LLRRGRCLRGTTAVAWAAQRPGVPGPHGGFPDERPPFVYRRGPLGSLLPIDDRSRIPDDTW